MSAPWASHFRLSCAAVNARHVSFALFDPAGANCGTVTILRADAKRFIAEDWRGDVSWNGRLDAVEQGGAP